MFFRETFFLHQGRLSIQTLQCIVYTSWLVDFKICECFLGKPFSSTKAVCPSRRSAHSARTLGAHICARTLGPQIRSAHLGAHIKIAHLDRRIFRSHIWTAHLLCTFGPLCFQNWRIEFLSGCRTEPRIGECFLGKPFSYTKAVCSSRLCIASSIQIG